MVTIVFFYKHIYIIEVKQKRVSFLSCEVYVNRIPLIYWKECLYFWNIMLSLPEPSRELNKKKKKKNHPGITEKRGSLHSNNQDWVK